MDIIRNGSIPSIAGPEDAFTGRVRQDARFRMPEPARGGAVVVTFEPGARTAWHTHPLGQLLIVTFGEGWAQREGGPKETIRVGDLVWFAPQERHWHGATDQTAMTHIAIAEAQDGTQVTWLEHVSDADYLS